MSTGQISAASPGTDGHLEGPRDHGRLQLLAPDGTRTEDSPFADGVTDLVPEKLLGLYSDMVTIRRIDNAATSLQRQGELGLWPPLLGQEAAQIGSGRALREDDFAFTSYREHGVAYTRGVDVVDLMRVWRGIAVSGWDPYAHNMATPQVIIGAQSLHATGWAMGQQLLGTDAAAIAYFGDGAMSEGDVSESLVFAASYSAPVVFFCQNNHWAISEPVSVQSRTELVDRAIGFGIPGIRVDGNDVLAVMAATREALERARSGGGPTFIEAVTYRMGPHTTADDPTLYRDAAEVEAWRERDPIDRLARHLRSTGNLDDEAEKRIDENAKKVVATMRAGVIALTEPEPMSIFDHVYSEPHAGLGRQKERFARYRDQFDDEAPAERSGSGKSTETAGAARAEAGGSR